MANPLRHIALSRVLETIAHLLTTYPFAKLFKICDPQLHLHSLQTGHWKVRGILYIPLGPISSQVPPLLSRVCSWSSKTGYHLRDVACYIEVMYLPRGMHKHRCMPVDHHIVVHRWGEHHPLAHRQPFATKTPHRQQSAAVKTSLATTMSEATCLVLESYLIYRRTCR